MRTRVIVVNWFRRELRDSHVLALVRRDVTMYRYSVHSQYKTSRVVQSYSPTRRGLVSPVRDSS